METRSWNGKNINDESEEETKAAIFVIQEQQSMQKVGTLNPAPQSLLVVCVGNTCRSPMAEALAKRRWPNCRVQSAGTAIANRDGGAASEAIATMEKIGLDINAHKQTPLSDIDLGEFEFVLALSKSVRRILQQDYGVEEHKIQNVYVDDPYGNDMAQYIKCMNAISNRLAGLEFANNSE